MNSDIKRENNFGILRLFFAALVIIAHSPEIIDGDRSREIFTRIFGTLSFGDAAVDGFFLISGYLITKSFVQKQSTLAFLIKRILRIIPGYLVCFWICVFVVAPFVGAENLAIKYQAVQAFFLLSPDVPGVFKGLPYPELNRSMWTIAYEFRCYLITILLGAVGLYKPRYRSILVFIIGLLFILNALHAMDGALIAGGHFIGHPENYIRFTAIYGVGMLFFLFREKIRFTTRGALLSAVLLIPLLFNSYLAESSLMIFGGYLIFWFAFKARVFAISRMVNKCDVSYGLYLYAWPIQSVVVWFGITHNPWLLCLITLAGASILAYASWMLIEKPFLRFAGSNKSARLMPQLDGATRGTDQS